MAYYETIGTDMYHMENAMKILIYGGGAVGLGLASFLQNAGCCVDIIARQDTVKALQANGLLRTGILGTHMIAAGKIRASSSLREISGRCYDYILICTKSFGTAHAAADIADYPALVHDVTAVVLCQNGWGNAQTASQRLPAEKIYNARVITGFCRPTRHEVNVTVHADDIHIGTLFGGKPDTIEPLCTALTSGGIGCLAVSDIAKDLWAKMLYNCALNPLGAICTVPYGALGDSPHARHLMDRIIDETFLAMNLAGYATHWSSAHEYRDLLYSTLIPKTARHESSMLQDILAGKPTEIDALNGAVLDIGRHNGQELPYTDTVVQMIQFLEQQPQRTSLLL